MSLRVSKEIGEMVEKVEKLEDSVKWKSVLGPRARAVLNKEKTSEGRNFDLDSPALGMYVLGLFRIHT
jgi:hypothetical protein